MGKTILFAGTEEGHRLAWLMFRREKPVHVCVASEYGNRKMDSRMADVTSVGRLSREEMKELFRTKEAEQVVDATSPFATAVQENIRAVCEELGLPYFRLRHPPASDLAEQDRDCRVVHSVEEAAESLKTLPGKVLLSLDLQETGPFLEWEDSGRRVVLCAEPSPEAMSACRDLGLNKKQILAVEDAASEELLAALLRHADATWLVAWERGGVAGVQAMMRAVKRADAGLILVSPEASGMSMKDVAAKVCPDILDELRELDVSTAAPRRITLLGVGMGLDSQLTWEGVCACREADVLIGAGRILAGLSTFEKPVHEVENNEEAAAFLQAHPEYQRPVVAFSGDAGFFSGARKMQEFLRVDQVQVISGISSLSCFCSRLRIPWEDVFSVNLHGRNINLVDAVRKHEKVFCVGGGRNRLQEACRELTECGLGDILLWVGEDLGYPAEKIYRTTPRKMQKEECSSLVAALFENDHTDETAGGRLPSGFVWEGSSLTGLSAEARDVILSRMELNLTSRLFDAASGNGSLAIEAARMAPEGLALAAAADEKAREAILKNRKKAGVPNMDLLEGEISDVLEKISFTHAFLRADAEDFSDVCRLLRENNPLVRILAAGSEAGAEAVQNFLKTEKAKDACCMKISITRGHPGSVEKAEEDSLWITEL